jgi:hypothetical protein
MITARVAGRIVFFAPFRKRCDGAENDSDAMDGRMFSDSRCYRLRFDFFRNCKQQYPYWHPYPGRAVAGQNQNENVGKGICFTLGGKQFEWNFPNVPFGALRCSN